MKLYRVSAIAVELPEVGGERRGRWPVPVVARVVTAAQLTAFAAEMVDVWAMAEFRVETIEVEDVLRVAAHVRVH